MTVNRKTLWELSPGKKRAALRLLKCSAQDQMIPTQEFSDNGYILSPPQGSSCTKELLSVLPLNEYHSLPNPKN